MCCRGQLRGTCHTVGTLVTGLVAFNWGLAKNKIGDFPGTFAQICGIGNLRLSQSQVWNPAPEVPIAHFCKASMPVAALDEAFHDPPSALGGDEGDRLFLT